MFSGVAKAVLVAEAMVVADRSEIYSTVILLYIGYLQRV